MESWSKHEVELIVADYFRMLSDEILGIPYKKSAHRKNLAPLLNNRSEGSIEFKHQNISAVLIALGQPYIKGYLPRYNYQAILKDAVIEHLLEDTRIEDQFRIFADRDIQYYPAMDFDNLLTEPPSKSAVPDLFISNHQRPIKVNYLEREQRNRKLGELGEQFVLQYEKNMLIKNNKEKLAAQVRWVSKEDGDGAGFDILSKNNNGTDKYIEVKTTKLGKETPFFFSRNELDFSQKNADNYHLFRLYDFENKARMFTLYGSLDSVCHPIPTHYMGHF